MHSPSSRCYYGPHAPIAVLAYVHGGASASPFACCTMFSCMLLVVYIETTFIPKFRARWYISDISRVPNVTIYDFVRVYFGYLYLYFHLHSQSNEPKRKSNQKHHAAKERTGALCVASPQTDNCYIPSPIPQGTGDASPGPATSPPYL